MRQLIIITLSIFCMTYANAKLFTVAQDAGTSAQYTTISAAISAAYAGDTIYVYPSNKTYGDITIDKKLTLIGGGAAPRTQNSTPTTIDDIELKDSAVSGTRIMGFNLGDINYKHTGNSKAHNIIINDNYIRDIVSVYGNNWLIENNICVNVGSSGSDAAVYIETGGTNIVLRNNIMNMGIDLRTNASGTLMNNTFVFKSFIRAIIYSNCCPKNANFNVINNIFYQEDPVSFCNHCTYKNNLTYLVDQDSIRDTGSNVHNINARDPLFVNVPSGGDIFSYSYDYHLKTASPAIGSGLNGYDMGAFGGPMPINMGSEPPIPQVRVFNLLTPTVPSGGNIKVKILVTGTR